MAANERAGPASILLIDDTPENLRVAVDLLEAYSFTLLTARDGEAGIKRARLTAPGLILLDVQMPGIDGYETCRRLKADPVTAAIPVIFMTVLSETAHKVDGFLAGGVDYVTKPIEAHELLARVRTHLALRSLQIELEARVTERTASLEREIAARVAKDVEREHLLEVVRAQSEQLHQLTHAWVTAQRERDRSVERKLGEHVADRLERVSAALSQAEELLAAEARSGATSLAQIRAHVTRAQELLRPAAEGADLVRSELATGTTALQVEDNPLLRLSTREYEIVQLIAHGKANKQIAQALDIARTTVSTHRTRLMEKLGVSDLPSLIRLLMRYEGDARRESAADGSDGGS
jgi:DNA-binding NarL/FixJ family response regulator